MIGGTDNYSGKEVQPAKNCHQKHNKTRQQEDIKTMENKMEDMTRKEDMNKKEDKLILGGHEFNSRQLRDFSQ